MVPSGLVARGKIAKIIGIEVSRVVGSMKSEISNSVGMLDWFRRFSIRVCAMFLIKEEFEISPSPPTPMAPSSASVEIKSTFKRTCSPKTIILVIFQLTLDIQQPFNVLSDPTLIFS